MKQSGHRAHFPGSVAVAAALAIATPATAAITDLEPGGFANEVTVHVAAPPAKVYQLIGKPALWWSADHTVSGSAANLSLDERAGGCFCEQLPNGGSVQHLVVVYANPGKILRLRGGLGPFQGYGVDTVLTWTLTQSGAGTDVTATFLVGGYVKGGMADLAKVADGVLALNTGRLKQFAETGSPDVMPQSAEMPTH